jgi:hypothetical protein
MLNRVSAFVLASILIFPAAARTQGDLGHAEQQVLQAEKARFAAMIKVDEAALVRLVGDDVAYIHSTALLQNKKEFIETLKAGGIKYLALTPSAPDLKVRIVGNMAVVNGLADVHVIDHGTEKNIRIRYTEVQINRNGAWQLASWQSTALP